MYWLNKIVGFIASPIGGVIVGGIAAVVCARIGRKRLAKWLGRGTAAWLWLWMTPIMTWIVGAPLEREFLVDGRVPMVETFPAADAIVVLGGGMGVETNLSPYAEMSAGADRVWQAARLYKAGKAKKIVATGDYAADSTLGLLVDFGVAKDDVSFLDARNTEEEAKGIREMLGRVEEEKGRRILLVTSAWHMKRARMMFKKYAPEIEVVCAPADFEMMMMAENMFSFKAVAPDVTAFQFNSFALREWIGIVGYKVFR